MLSFDTLIFYLYYWCKKGTEQRFFIEFIKNTERNTCWLLLFTTARHYFLDGYALPIMIWFIDKL